MLVSLLLITKVFNIVRLASLLMMSKVFRSRKVGIIADDDKGYQIPQDWHHCCWWQRFSDPAKLVSLLMMTKVFRSRKVGIIAAAWQRFPDPARLASLLMMTKVFYMSKAIVISFNWFWNLNENKFMCFEILGKLRSNSEAASAVRNKICVYHTTGVCGGDGRDVRNQCIGNNCHKIYRCSTLKPQSRRRVFPCF